MEPLDFISSLYGDNASLHAPVFRGNEKKYLNHCIDLGYVLDGPYIEKFENSVRDFTGAKYAVGVSSGTAALHVALLLVGVMPGDEVITQPLTFVATANAISYRGAEPVFVDVDLGNCGMSPGSLKSLLEANPGRKFAACVPVHTFGHPCRIDEIVEICREHGIPVVEDSAQGLGSIYKDQHVGTFGDMGIFSFSGNKIITAGGMGMIVTDNKELALRAEYLSKTAKVPKTRYFIHEEIGFNYKMSNLNAALGFAMMEYLPIILQNKRQTAYAYKRFFQNTDMEFVDEPSRARSNFWLNAILMKDKSEQDSFLTDSENKGIECRPVWTLMTNLEMYKDCESMPLKNAQWLEDRIVNLPSGVRW